MAVLTLSQALDRAKAGEPISVNATLAASMTLATNTLALQAAMKAAKCGRCAASHSPGSTGPQHQGPPKRPRCGRQSRGRFQILGGRLGGYYLGSWKADADSPWWPR
jgi:hypothetical protein